MEEEKSASDLLTYVLVSVLVELIVFLAANMRLCFGFAVKTGLIM